MFVVRASVWLKALQQFRPDIDTATRTAWAARSTDASFVRPDKAGFAAIPAESIDYAVLEKCPGTAGFDLRMVPLEAVTGALSDLADRALERAIQWHHLHVGFSFLEEADFLATQTDRTHVEGLVNQLLLLEGTDFAVLLTEQQGVTNASLRSKGFLDAQQLAHRWGGGGHPQAAGFRTHRALGDVAETLKKELEHLYLHGHSCPS